MEKMVADEAGREGLREASCDYLRDYPMSDQKERREAVLL